MNKDQSKGKLRQIKGMAKKAWGWFTDDDIKKAEGSADELIGTIQEKLGDAKKKVTEKTDEI